MNTVEHGLMEQLWTTDNQVTEKLIGCAIAVSNQLGIGFLEKVYENAQAIELKAAGLNLGRQAPIRVWYRGEVVGEYVADLIVEGCILVELKHATAIHDVFLAQCLNYLRATRLRTCLLLNFGTPRLGVKRISL